MPLCLQLPASWHTWSMFSTARSMVICGFDANYPFRGRIDPALEQSASHELLATHFLSLIHI